MAEIPVATVRVKLDPSALIAALEAIGAAAHDAADRLRELDVDAAPTEVPR